MNSVTIKKLEAESNALIKLLLTEMEELAALQPDQACEPYALEARKKRIRRRLWEHHRTFVNALGD